MTGPKHLWSGDWQNQSRPPASPPPALTADQSDDAAGSSAPQDAANSARRRFPRRQLATALSVGVVTAAVAAAAILTLGGGATPGRAHTHSRPHSPGSPSPAPSPSQGSGGGGLSTPSPQSCQQTGGCAQTTSVPTVQGPTAEWMGMQIVTSPAGVVVSTVKLGSAADQAGAEPGDQIEAVDGHILGSVSELGRDTAGLKLGSPVTLQVMRSSVQLTLASIHMTQRPTIHP